MKTPLQKLAAELAPLGSVNVIGGTLTFIPFGKTKDVHPITLEQLDTE